MQVKIFLYTLVAVILASFLPAEAQQDKVYRVGILTSPGKAEERGQIKGLRDGLREAGYSEGENLRLNINGRGENPMHAARLTVVQES